MAKVKGRPKKPGGEGTQVRIDSDIANMARYLIAQTEYSWNGLLGARSSPLGRAGSEMRDASSMNEIKPKGKDDQ